MSVNTLNLAQHMNRKMLKFLTEKQINATLSYLNNHNLLYEIATTALYG